MDSGHNFKVVVSGPAPVFGKTVVENHALVITPSYRLNSKPHLATVSVESEGGVVHEVALLIDKNGRPILKRLIAGGTALEVAGATEEKDDTPEDKAGLV